MPSGLWLSCRRTGDLMDHRKIIFLDVDGTLVDYKGKIPESAAAAVCLARQRGHKVYICTGRSRAEVYSEIWDIGLDGMNGGNGNYIEDNGQVVMHRCLSPDECRRIVECDGLWKVFTYLGLI